MPGVNSLRFSQSLPSETPPFAHPIHRCHLRGESDSGVAAARVGHSGLGDLAGVPPPPSHFCLRHPHLPLGKLKSELGVLVNKCPEEPLEGDMSSPNSMSTQVMGSGELYLWNLSETKAVTR